MSLGLFSNNTGKICKRCGKRCLHINCEVYEVCCNCAGYHESYRYNRKLHCQLCSPEIY